MNQFARTELLLGRAAMNTLFESKVAVFGLGGVGSFAAEALARSGIGHLVLVDHDLVSVTNINRQIHANHRTIGKSKVKIMGDRILDINPEAQVETFQLFYPGDNPEKLVRAEYDYIVDAIDTVSSKIELIVRSKAKDIPIISCMGTGNKLDPSQLKIADIYQTTVCPLARIMRRELKKRGISELTVVFSTEKPLVPIKTANSTGESGIDDYRTNRQVPGSIAFVPSAAGLLIAGHVVRNLIRTSN